MLQKNQATKLKYKKALIKLQSNSSRQIWCQVSAKILNTTWNPIGPAKLLQSIWLDINSKPWSDMISFHSVKWYHITSRVSFLFTALSHWYPHIIFNNNNYCCGKFLFFLSYSEAYTPWEPTGNISLWCTLNHWKIKQTDSPPKWKIRFLPWGWCEYFLEPSNDCMISCWCFIKSDNPWEYIP